jgi:hypothetical protein
MGEALSCLPLLPSPSFITARDFPVFSRRFKEPTSGLELLAYSLRVRYSKVKGAARAAPPFSIL